MNYSTPMPEYLRRYLADNEDDLSPDNELLTRFLVDAPNVGLDFYGNHYAVILTDGTRCLKVNIYAHMNFENVCDEIEYTMAALQSVRGRSNADKQEMSAYIALGKQLEQVMAEYAAATANENVDLWWLYDSEICNYGDYCQQCLQRIA